MKRFLITLVEIAVIALAIIGIVSLVNSVSLAEDYFKAYVVCQPNDYINVRHEPSKKSEVVGYCMPGDWIRTDGKEKNKFLHVFGIGEYGEGWIHTGYIVYDQPEKLNKYAEVICKGRLAARKCINGDRRKWLKKGAKIQVYLYTNEWCVTNSGFVKTKYIELEGI